LNNACFKQRTATRSTFWSKAERGIGKSSLLFLVEAIGSGVVTTVHSNERLTFLTLFVDLGGVQDQLDIVRCIGRELGRDAIKQKAAKACEFLSKWEILGIRFHHDVGATAAEDARDEFVSGIVNLWMGAKDALDGIFILVDEADGPSVDAFGRIREAIYRASHEAWL